MSASRLAAVMVAAVVALAACGRDGAPPPSLRMGTGETRFEALANGQEVTLIRGPQGGVHMWLALKVDGLNPAKVWLDVETRYGAQVRQSRAIQKLDAVDGQATLVGWPAIMDESAFVDGDTVSVHVLLTDETGESAQGEVRVKLRMPAVTNQGSTG
jgi:hypothetical protein